MRALRREINLVRRRIAPYRAQILRSRFGPFLRRHIKGLATARATYGRAFERRARSC
ncbi:MAG: hypothetical protein HY581_05900 [Nitrospirae bacterium]|nr:hypothetical protein [Nitrospirota bacterium]